jgi:hypothetical protein
MWQMTNVQAAGGAHLHTPRVAYQKKIYAGVGCYCTIDKTQEDV